MTPSHKNAVQAAAQSLRDDPTFANMKPQEREAEVCALLRSLGGDASDVEQILDVLAQVEQPAPPALKQIDVMDDAGPAPKLTIAPGMVPSGPSIKKSPPPPAPATTASLETARASLLYRFKLCAGVTDGWIGTMLGIPRSTVQAIIGRRVAENITPTQRSAMRATLLLAQDDIEALLSDLTKAPAP